MLLQKKIIIYKEAILPTILIKIKINLIFLTPPAHSNIVFSFIVNINHNFFLYNLSYIEKSIYVKKHAEKFCHPQNYAFLCSV